MASHSLLCSDTVQINRNILFQDVRVNKILELWEQTDKDSHINLGLLQFAKPYHQIS